MHFRKHWFLLGMIIFAGSAGHNALADRVLSYLPYENKYLVLENGSHVYMYENHGTALNRILQNMHIETAVLGYIGLINPNIQSLQIVVGDLSHPNSVHPENTHRDYKTFDVDYLTLGPDNRTQYGCHDGHCSNIAGKWKLYYEKNGRLYVKDENTRRWHDPNYDSDPTVYYGFDWERTWLFYKKIHDVFPGCRILVYAKLRDNIRKHLNINYGLSYAAISNLFGSWFVGDTSTSYNHHTHAHITLGNVIDYNALGNLAYYGPGCYSSNDNHPCYNDIRYD